MQKVSIVISNYNYGEFLAVALDSALSQDYRSIEVIAVDDGSTDDSPRILQSYERRVKVFLQPHSGETASRNFGFLQSTGDLVCFLDADDYLQVNAIARIVSFWRDSFSKVQYHLRVVDRSGRDQNLRMPRCRLDSGRVEHLLLESGRYVTSPGSGNVYPRWFLEKILPVPEAEWPQSFDSYASTYAGFCGEIGAIQDALGSYRVHDKNMSRALSASNVELAQIEKLMSRGIRLKSLIQQIAKDLGMQANDDIVTSHWMYLKLELARLKLSSNPSALLLWRTAKKIIASANSAPELSFSQRLQLISWALGATTLPRVAAAPLVSLGFDVAPQNRFYRAMRRL